MASADQLLQPAARRRPPAWLSWPAAVVVAAPQVLLVGASAVGTVELTPFTAAQAVGVLGLSLFVGAGHRWACAVLSALGAVVLAAAVLDPGMLVAGFALVGALYLLLGLGLLLASRARRPVVGASSA